MDRGSDRRAAHRTSAHQRPARGHDRASGRHVAPPSLPAPRSGGRSQGSNMPVPQRSTHTVAPSATARETRSAARTNVQDTPLGRMLGSAGLVTLQPRNGALHTRRSVPRRTTPPARSTREDGGSSGRGGAMPAPPSSPGQVWSNAAYGAGHATPSLYPAAYGGDMPSVSPRDASHRLPGPPRPPSPPPTRPPRRADSQQASPRVQRRRRPGSRTSPPTVPRPASPTHSADYDPPSEPVAELAECHAIIGKQRDTIRSLQARVAQLEDELTTQRLRNARLADTSVHSPEPRGRVGRRSDTAPPVASDALSVGSSEGSPRGVRHPHRHSHHVESQRQHEQPWHGRGRHAPKAGKSVRAPPPPQHRRRPLADDSDPSIAAATATLDSVRQRAQDALAGARAALEGLEAREAGHTPRREAVLSPPTAVSVQSWSTDDTDDASAPNRGTSHRMPNVRLDYRFFYDLVAGVAVRKHGKWGSSHARTLWLNCSEQPPELVWQQGSRNTRALVNGLVSGTLSLGQVSHLTTGVTSKVLQRSGAVENSDRCCARVCRGSGIGAAADTVCWSPQICGRARSHAYTGPGVYVDRGMPVVLPRPRQPHPFRPRTPPPQGRARSRLAVRSCQRRPTHHA